MCVFFWVCGCSVGGAIFSGCCLFLAHSGQLLPSGSEELQLLFDVVQEFDLLSCPLHLLDELLSLLGALDLGDFDRIEIQFLKKNQSQKNDKKIKFFKKMKIFEFFKFSDFSMNLRGLPS